MTPFRWLLLMISLACVSAGLYAVGRIQLSAIQVQAVQCEHLKRIADALDRTHPAEKSK